jgi:hypothetical protein
MPLPEPTGNAPRDAAADRGVALVVPSASSYLGVAASSSAAPLQALPDLGVRIVSSSEAFNITLPANTFTVGERSSMNIVVQVRQINGRPLPGWLKFDARNGTLTGRPPAGFNGNLDVEISARDTEGHRATSVIHIDVQAPRPTAGRAGLDAQFRTARADARLDERLLDQLDAAAPERAVPESIH